MSPGERRTAVRRVLLSSIRGRNEARTYAKPVAGWAADHELSPEESEAVAHARMART